MQETGARNQNESHSHSDLFSSVFHLLATGYWRLSPISSYASLVLKIAFRRLQERLGLTLLCLLGICLSAGLVVAIPAFSDLAARIILLRELATSNERANCPLFSLRYYCLPNEDWPLPVEQVTRVGAWLEQNTQHQIGLPIVARYSQVESPGMLFEPGSSGATTPFKIAFVDGAEQHLEIVEGDPFTADDASPYVTVWVQEWLAAKLGLNVGEVRRLAYSVPGGRRFLPVRIAGIWQPKPGSEGFWYGDPTKVLQFAFLTTRPRYQRLVQPAFAESTGFAFWYFVLDDRRLALDRLDSYAKGLQRLQQISASRLPRAGMDLAPMESLWRAHERKTILSSILFGLSLPVLGLLFIFLGMISAVAVRYQRGEAALLTSRGATHLHIVGISLAEALLLAALGLPLSLLVGYAFSRLAAQSQGLLSFAYRPLPAIGLQGVNPRLLTLALALTVALRVGPALLAGRSNIVAYERQRSRPQKTPAWLHLSLVVPLVAVSAYAYRQLRLRGTVGLLSWEPSGSPAQEPLAFLAPTLCLLTAALLLAGFFPILMHLFEHLAAGRLAIPGYLGFRSLGREGGQYVGALFLVTLCLAVGGFLASVARSADRWFVERLQYKAGADLTFQPLTEGDSNPWLLPVSDYLQLPGVEDVMRVGDYWATQVLVSNSLGREKLRLLAIDRQDFPRIAYWQRDYAPEPLGALMNRLASRQDALLLPRQALGNTGLAVGDQIRLEIEIGYGRAQLLFTIIGVFDYFPTMFPEEGCAAVGNLDYVADAIGYMPPWDVWMRTAPGLETARVRLELKDRGVKMTHVRDLREWLDDERLRLERVGIYGMLSVGFLAAGVVSCLGLLLYLAASFVSRLQRFAVLCALGCEPSELLTVLILEFFAVATYGVGGGAILGVLASRLFVPYLQLTEDPRLPVPPFAAEIAWPEIAALGLAFAAVLAAAAAGLFLGVARRQLAQSLRLGDQE